MIRGLLGLMLMAWTFREQEDEGEEEACCCGGGGSSSKELKF